MAKEKVTIRIEADVMARLRDRAQVEGVTVSAAMEEAARSWVDKAGETTGGERDPPGRAWDLLASQLAAKDAQLADMTDRLAEAHAIARTAQASQAVAIAAIEPAAKRPKQSLWRRLIRRGDTS